MYNSIYFHTVILLSQILAVFLNVVIFIYSFIVIIPSQIFATNCWQKECIPVWCIPPAAVPVRGEGSAQGGGGVCPEGVYTSPLWTESQTGVKTLPSRNFVCAR